MSEFPPEEEVQPEPIDEEVEVGETVDAVVEPETTDFVDEGGEVVVNEAFGKLAKAARAMIVGALQDLVDGAQEDLQQFGTAMAQDVARYATTGKEEMLRELEEQAKLLAEVQRIRMVNASNDVIGMITVAAAQGLRKLVGLGLVALV